MFEWAGTPAKVDMEIDGEPFPVKIKKSREKVYLLLPGGEGILSVVEDSGATARSIVRLSETSKYFKVHRNCKLDGFQIRFDKAASPHFAGVYCRKSRDGKVLRVYFSTSQNSDWLGGDLFELEGKGQRFKVYDIPLDRKKAKFSLNWGGRGIDSSATISIHPVSTKNSEEPPPYFFIGAEFSQQTTASRGDSSSNLSLVGRLDMLYPVNPRWRMSGNMGYLLHSLSSSQSSSPKYSQFKLGGDCIVGSGVFLAAGYDLLSFSSDQPEVLVDFEAPYVGLGYRRQMSKRSLDVGGFYSQPISGGAGSQRMGFQVTLKPFYFTSNSKVVVNYEILKIVEPVTIDSTRMGLQYYYGF
ncbi:hypothetical protein GW916_12580 [bacterium]|nr:hypothetical protein [bacterium]